MSVFHYIVELQQMIAAPAAAKGLQAVYGGEMLTATEVGEIQRAVGQIRIELSQKLQIPNPPKMKDWDFSMACMHRLTGHPHACFTSPRQRAYFI